MDRTSPVCEQRKANGRRLRVMAVAGEYPKLSETFVVDQIQRLEQAGHQVRVVGSPAGRIGTPQALLPRHPFPSGRSATRRRMVVATLEAGRRAPRATTKLLLDREVDRFRTWRLLETMLPLLGTPAPDVYHCHFGWFGAQMVQILDALGQNTPVVTSFHGQDVSEYVRQHGSTLYDSLFAQGALFLPVSEYWRDRLLELGAPSERTVVLHMGVDPTQFAPQERSRRAAGPFRVLSVGRHVAKKGLDAGLRAVAELSTRGVDVAYRLIGDGPERQRLESLADQLGITSRVTFEGSRPRETVLRALYEHDVLLCPSVTGPGGDQEGIPVVLMEAMATQLPVVSSWHSGIPELVIHDRSGLLAREHDDSQLADHLERLEGDPDLARRLGSEGRRQVEANFHVDRQVERLASLLTEVSSGAR